MTHLLDGCIFFSDTLPPTETAMIERKKSIDRNAPVTGSFRRTRNLPHIQNAGATYACNTRSAVGKIFSPEERTIVFDSIHFLRKTHYDLFATVVMPDHIHLVIKPNEIAQGWIALPKIFHSLKGYTGKVIEKVNGHVWQDEHFDAIIRSEREFNEQISYVENNPVEAGLVSHARDYPWPWHIGLDDPDAIIEF